MLNFFNQVLNFLNQNSGAIQAAATIVLVWVTIYYAIQTKKTVNQMQETRRYEFLPILEIYVKAIDLNRICISLGNIGKGLARFPQASIPLLSEPVVFNNIGPRGFEEKETNLQSRAILDLPEDDRKIKIEYLDVFSRKITSEAHFIAETTEENDPRRGHLTIDNWNIILPE